MNHPNEITIYGRLGRDPELRYTKKQEPLCTFSVAENVEGQDKPNWHNIIVWGKEAEHWASNLKKGTSVFVRGRKNEREFTNDKGIKKLYQEVKAEAIGFTGL